MASNEDHLQERLPILSRIKVAFDKYFDEIGEKPKFLRLGQIEKAEISALVRGENVGSYITDQDIEKMTIGGMTLAFASCRTAIDLAHKEGSYLSLRRTSKYFIQKSNDAVDKIKQLN